ncbi:unnamed protein product [Ilex paraguariensis]|uniref:DUF4283 domain-containing protein n=1 Tax=Ilex paraguariensis TaxID=185542 RepID=A0ABC8T8K8_9AQUA
MEITIDHKHFKVRSEGLHGELVRIMEWNRFGYFSCLLNRSCVRWLKEMFSEALSWNRRDIFFRKFRRDGYCMWMQLENSRFGEFARITQMMNNGRRKGLIIPQGSQGIGWKGFRGLMEDVLSGGRNTRIHEKENQSLMVVSKSRVREQGNGGWVEMHKENTPANNKGDANMLKEEVKLRCVVVKVLKNTGLFNRNEKGILQGEGSKEILCIGQKVKDESCSILENQSAKKKLQTKGGLRVKKRKEEEEEGVCAPQGQNKCKDLSSNDRALSHGQMAIFIDETKALLKVEN